MFLAANVVIYGGIPRKRFFLFSLEGEKDFLSKKTQQNKHFSICDLIYERHEFQH